MKNSFKFFSDPSHGWIKVEKALLFSLGIIDKITGYSYQRGNFAYLEEDQDYGIFYEAYLTKYGKTPILIHMPQSNTDSRIRNYERFGRV